MTGKVGFLRAPGDPKLNLHWQTGMFPKIGLPQNGWFIMALLNWMIWGYPYFWKPPYKSSPFRILRIQNLLSHRKQDLQVFFW